MISNFIDKIKENIDLEKGWLPLLNQSLKWSVNFFIRVTAVSGTILFVIFIIKKSNLVKDIRTMIVNDAMGITPKGAKVISSPDINYDQDLKNTSDIIKMLEGKKKNNAKKNK